MITANCILASQNLSGGSSQLSRKIGSTVSHGHKEREPLLAGSTVTALALKRSPKLLCRSFHCVWAPCTARRWRSDPAHSPGLCTSRPGNRAGRKPDGARQSREGLPPQSRAHTPDRGAPRDRREAARGLGACYTAVGNRDHCFRLPLEPTAT